MCGITAILLSSMEPTALRNLCLSRSTLIRHRGPDWTGIHVIDWGGKLRHVMAHERLAVVDPTNGKQPLFDPELKVVCVANGEIYNHMALRTKLPESEVKEFASQSDCQVIPSLFKHYGCDFVKMLDGDFAIVCALTETGEVFAARDPMGVDPMFMGHATDGTIWFCSEIKGIQEDCIRVREFPPGHYFTFNFDNGCGELRRFFIPMWMTVKRPQNRPFYIEDLRSYVEAAIAKRLMCDVPLGLIVNGDLDTSIIATVASQLYKQQYASQDDSHMWTPKIHSFTVGLKDSMSLKYARLVADNIGSVHHEFTFEIQEAIDALQDVIQRIESYDVGTVRLSTLNYFLYRVIKSMGVKMVISGEGAREIFSCISDTRSADDSYAAAVRKLSTIYVTEALRASKMAMCWGVENRIPYLDLSLIDYLMSVNPDEKLCAKMQPLRDAYADCLPPEIVNRVEVGFDCAASSSWINEIHAYAEKEVTDFMMSNAEFLFPYNTPLTKEAYLYRKIFSQLFPDKSAAKTVVYNFGDLGNKDVIECNS